MCTFVMLFVCLSESGSVSEVLTCRGGAFYRFIIGSPHLLSITNYGN